MLHASVTALLEALAAIERQVARLDEQLKGLARRSPVCWRLMSVPAAGPSVGLSSCRPAIERQVARLDEQLKGLARRSPVCWRLMSVPAAGPSVGLSSCRRPRT